MLVVVHLGWGGFAGVLVGFKWNSGGASVVPL